MGASTLALQCRVVKLVRALRKGWIKRDKEEPKSEPEAYLLWADDGKVSDKTATGLSYVPAPKPQLPGHEASYHPPPEFLPTEVVKHSRLLCMVVCDRM